MRTERFLIVCTLAASMLAASGCGERPPIETEQVGYRGTGMVQLSNPRDEEPQLAFPQDPPLASSDGPKARDVYQNVQVLGDLSVAEFTRLMTVMTTWVSPEQNCAYCHNLANLASDELYTKGVSRRMLQMTQHINENYSAHVGNTGVNCYTCHRGKNVPEYIWFEDNTKDFGEYFIAGRHGQNRPAESVGYTSMLADPFSSNLTAPMSEVANRIRVASDSPYPTKDGFLPIQAAEETYALMMHLSTSLGVNCTYCHNTQSFQSWSNSTPQRATAWHGIQMVRDLNADYLMPLQDVWPENRLGPGGDGPKLYCSTCHQGVNKPLGGAPATEAYPSLRSVSY